MTHEEFDRGLRPCATKQRIPPSGSARSCRVCKYLLIAESVPMWNDSRFFLTTPTRAVLSWLPISQWS